MRRCFGVFLVILMFACDSNTTNRNPYLTEYNFSYTINTNLPLYSSLTNEGSAIYLDNSQAGINGVFVIKTSTSFSGYRAYEASCPNHEISSCSTMTLDSSGNSVTCSCEDYNYTLFTGQLLSDVEDSVDGYYNMLEYTVTASSNIISISN
jgi:nitrite reductase/ring-hydroxylating ferredoxin subunit